MATAAVSLSVIAATPAQAAEKPAPVEQGYQTQARGLGITLTAGPTLLKRYGFRDEHLGLLTVNGKPGICYDYGEKSPDGSWKSGPIPDVKAGPARDQMQWIANAHWADALKSDKGAAAYKSAINRLRSAEFRADWSKSYVGQLKRGGNGSVVALADAWIADAKQFAGPVKLDLDFSKPAPGGIGTALVKASVKGKAYLGATVKWALVGGSVKTAGKTTSKDGTAKLSYLRGAGPVSIKAVATVPEWREAGYTVPSSASKQHLIRGGYSTNVTAGAKFDSLLGATVSSKCDATCAGKPPVTFSAKASSSPVRWQAVAGGKVLKTLEIGAGKTGTATFTGVDGQVISLRYAVKVGGKWSEYRTAKSFTVVCPAWPAVTMTKDCACKGGGKATYTFTSPGGIRLYDVTLNGQMERISGTQAVTLAVPVKAGTSVNATFTAYDAAGKQISSGVLDAWTQS